MKFVCRRCEQFMLFKKAEEPGKDSLGITFECPSCQARVAMVTNAGETHLVQALGVKLGGRAEAPEPFELTRSAMRQGAEADQAVAATLEASKGKCPFANMMAGGTADPAALAEAAKALKAETPAPQAASVGWTEAAAKRLENIPGFIRPAAKIMIEKMAAERGASVVDESLLEEAKTRFM